MYPLSKSCFYIMFSLVETTLNIVRIQFNIIIVIIIISSSSSISISIIIITIIIITIYDIIHYLISLNACKYAA